MFSERPDSPDVFDVMQEMLAERLRDVHTATPGRVESYDAATQTATVLPLIRHATPQPDGTPAYEDLPVLTNVKVMFPRMGGWFVTLPVARGDFVLLVFCESAIGHWAAGDGGPAHPGDLRRHRLANAVALPGMFPTARALTNAATTANTGLALGHDSGAMIEITSDGDVKATPAPGRKVLLAGGDDFVALAALVKSRIDTLQTAHDTHVHSGGTIMGATDVPAELIGPLDDVAASDTKAT